MTKLFADIMRTEYTIDDIGIMVLWCKDRGTAIKELHDEVLCEYVIDKHGCRK